MEIEVLLCARTKAKLSPLNDDSECVHTQKHLSQVFLCVCTVRVYSSCGGWTADRWYGDATLCLCAVRAGRGVGGCECTRWRWWLMHCIAGREGASR